MPLDDPLNDVKCLRLLHATVLDLMAMPWVKEFAAQFDNIGELVAYIRSLEQRDDLGVPSDGPRLPCEISQRLRFAPSDPNCFERTALFLAIALLIDPSLTLSSASMLLDDAWHTFPVEIRNGIPHMVVLDPIHAPPRNAMMFTAWEARHLAPNAARNVAPWFAQLARNACIDQGAERSYDLAIDSVRNSLISGTPLQHAGHIDRVLEFAEPDAAIWRARGQKAFQHVSSSLRNLDLSLKSGALGKVLGRVLDTGKDIAPDVIRSALIAEFGPVAAVALKGVDLAMGKGKTARKPVQISPAEARRRKRRAQLRRMSFGFRQI